MLNDIVVYRIDADDRLVGIGRAWDAFAVGNQGRHLVGELVTGRSLWDFITDETTRQLYQALVARVRAGHEAVFDFRCDSPDCRRYLRMRMSAAANDVIFEVTTVRLEDRESQLLLDPQIPRDERLVVVCSWCKKVADEDGAWHEVEQETARRGLFARATMPELSHGICETCLTAMRRKYLPGKH